MSPTFVEENSDPNIDFNRAAIVGECKIPGELAILLGSDGKVHSRYGGFVKRSPVVSKSGDALQAGITPIPDNTGEFEREVIDLPGGGVQVVVFVRITSTHHCPAIFI